MLYPDHRVQLPARQVLRADRGGYMLDQGGLHCGVSRESPLVECSANHRLLLLGLIIDLGGVPGTDRIGFRYWRDPGAFVQYAGNNGEIAGTLGRFLGFFT